MATTFRVGTPAELGSLDPTQFLTWVIERAGRAVGYLVLTYGGSPDQARSAYVTGLYVEPEARGQGIGAKALQFAGDVGRAFGLRIYSKGVVSEDKQLSAVRRATA
jgi:GNAT superfamily N-acetyltransferase